MTFSSDRRVSLTTSLSLVNLFDENIPYRIDCPVDSGTEIWRSKIHEQGRDRYIQRWAQAHYALSFKNSKSTMRRLHHKKIEKGNDVFRWHMSLITCPPHSWLFKCISSRTNGDLNETKIGIQKDRQMKTAVAAFFFLIFDFPPILFCVPSGAWKARLWLTFSRILGRLWRSFFRKIPGSERVKRC